MRLPQKNICFQDVMAMPLNQRFDDFNEETKAKAPNNKPSKGT